MARLAMSDVEEIAKVVLVTMGAQQVLAAPAKAVGEVLADRIKGRLEHVLGRARDKGMDAGEPMSDRMAYKVLTEAAFTDDKLTLEYLAGVMAASGEDDAGAAVVAQIGRLSAFQLRLHYVVYRELRRLWPATAQMNLGQETEAQKAALRVPIEDFVSAFGTPPVAQTGSAVTALIREGLLHREWQFGPDDGTWTLRVRPSAVGAELFLWGHGEENWSAGRFFEPNLELQPLDVPRTPGVTLLNPPAIPETVPDAEASGAEAPSEHSPAAE
jgi:hypothetical protein